MVHCSLALALHLLFWCSAVHGQFEIPTYFDILKSQPLDTDSHWLELDRNFELKAQLISKLSAIIEKTGQNFETSQSPFNPLVDQCLTDLTFFVENLRLGKKWALKVVDSFGKPHSGLMTGNVQWLGDKSECEGIHASGNVSKMLANYSLGHSDFHGAYGFAVIEARGTVNVAVPGATLFGRILWGFCTSRACVQANFTELEDAIAEIIHGIIHKNVTINAKFAVVYPSKLHSVDGPAGIAICVLCLLAMLLISGTSLDLYLAHCGPNDNRPEARENGFPVIDADHDVTDTARIVDAVEHEDVNYKDQEMGMTCKILLCFSLLRNGKKVLTTEQGQNDVSSLHGMRFLSMAWIILGHTFYFGFTNTANPLDLMDPYHHGFSFQAILQATYSVDTFFLLSGFLLAYHFFRMTQKNPERLESWKFWLTFYFHRFWRLTPTYAIILCTYIGLWKYVGNGPLWPKYGFEVDQCKRSWWTNLLYVNNLVDIYSPSTDGRLHPEWCAGWTWYLANDMQFFWLSPLILYPLRKSWIRGVMFGGSSVPSRLPPMVWWLIGWVTLFGGLIGSMVATGVISVQHNLPPNMFPPNMKIGDKFTLLYIKPWARVIPFLVGIAAAQAERFITETGVYNQTYRRFRKLFNFVGWFTSAWLCGLVLFGLWPQYRGTVYGAQMAAFYAAGSRFAWSLGVSWVIIACASANAGPVNRFLSWKVWVPLSRLTFCAYLIHPMIMYAFYFSLPAPFQYTDANMTWYFAGFLLYTYIGAFFVSICVESPFMALDKLFFQGARS